ncbi:Maf/Ham1 [Ascobolus immersus RN42]|uniref:Maf/Ham1 n=1 Tax=Ascobolus immersus RN42 TaxID=1160509 RepID=A0A3N4I8N5_ASCIM|nr:Maf/Ham1 [Ascobolus immersus RN42]
MSIRLPDSATQPSSVSEKRMSRPNGPPGPGGPGGPGGPRPPRRPLPLDVPVLSTLRTKRVILASASPRRLTLLSALPLPTLEIIPSTFAENLDKETLDPFAYVSQTAMEKTLDVYKREVDKDLLFEGTKGGTGNYERRELGIVIGADTVVVSPSGQILEKPKSEKEHFAMLQALRDGPHHVLTAICVMAPRDDLRVPGYKLETHVEDTKVVFDKTMTDEFLWSYVRTREGADKAGGYAIQGVGGVLVEGIEGSWDNVVGLPVRWTLRLIEKVLSPDPDEIGSEDEFFEM